MNIFVVLISLTGLDLSLMVFVSGFYKIFNKLFLEFILKYSFIYK